jgi:hypothetical protein
MTPTTANPAVGDARSRDLARLRELVRPHRHHGTLIQQALVHMNAADPIETVNILARIGDPREGRDGRRLRLTGLAYRYFSLMSEHAPDSPDAAAHLAGTITRLRGEYLSPATRRRRSATRTDYQGYMPPSVQIAANVRSSAKS